MKCGLFNVVIRLFVFLLFCLCSFSGKSQSIDYTVHANIIYHFTKYVNWPNEDPASDFVIGVLGNTPMESELKKATANKFVGKHRIVIRKFYANDLSFDCNILFIAEDKSSLLKKVSAITVNSPVLLVTEEEGLSQKGSCINFVIDDDRTKLEFNTANINKRNLKIANDLLALGIVVK